MGWPWRFNFDLTDEDKHARRDALDWYALVAQLSALVPLFVVQYVFLTRWALRKLSGSGSEVPSSPMAKSIKTGKLESCRRMGRKLGWWMGEEMAVFGTVMGTRGEVLGSAAWGIWLVALCVAQTGDDYFHVTKRFGIVAASQLPCHYLLALKSPYSPLQFLTRSSHETLNSLHQLLGRVITVLFYCHAVFYLNFYIQSGLLGSKLQEAYVLCGLVGIISFTVIGTTALEPVRRRSYRVFYITHVTLATALLPILFFHVSHIRPYLYQTAAIYIANAILRTLTSKPHTGTITKLSNANLIEIRIPSPPPARQSRLSAWQPGQHAYISLPGSPLLRTFRSNPFTLASLPHIDNELKFIARVLDGNTLKLAQSATTNTQNRAITLEGPYGLASHAERLLSYDRILLFAGGVGATFIVPIYRQLLADLSPSKRSLRRSRVSFVWIARTMGDVKWAVPEGKAEREGFAERMKVCITGDDVGAIRGEGADETFKIADEEDEDAGPGEEGIELEEREQLLSSEGGAGKEEDGELHVSAGRPDVRRLVDQTFAQSSGERVAVLVCGPRGLNRSVRKHVGEWVMKGRDVWFWEERFGM